MKQNFRILIFPMVFSLLLAPALFGTTIDEAILDGDWEFVHKNLDMASFPSREVKEFIGDIACLALDLDCAPSVFERSPDEARSLNAAEKWIKGQLEENSKNSTLYYLYGMIYSMRGDQTTAIQKLNQAIAFNGSNELAYLQRGVIQVMNRRYQLAIPDYDRAIEINPNSVKALVNRGAAYDGLKQYDLALADYSMALSIKPNSAAIYYNRANTFRHKYDNQSAIDDYSKALELDPTMAGAYYNRANAHADALEYNEAIADYRQFVSMAPPEMQRLVPIANGKISQLSHMTANRPRGEAESALDRGISMLQQGQFVSALWQFNAAISADSTLSDAYYYRAAANSMMNRLLQALDDYATTVRLKPNDTTAYYNRGSILANLGRHEEAISDFTSAIGCNDKYAAAYLGRAQSFEKTGQTKNAIADYRAFVQYCPSEGNEQKAKIEQLLAYLQTGPDNGGSEEAKAAVESAYNAWGRMDWEMLADKIETKDLDNFKELCLPLIKRLVEPGNDFFALHGTVYSLSSLISLPPRAFFKFQMELLTTKDSEYRDFFRIKFQEVNDLLPRADNTFAYNCRITFGGETMNQEIMAEGEAAKEVGVWKIAMPPVFLKVAQALNAVAQR